MLFFQLTYLVLLVFVSQPTHPLPGKDQDYQKRFVLGSKHFILIFYNL